MRVLVTGQEPIWVMQLSEACEKYGIEICTEKDEEPIDFLITNSAEHRKGSEERLPFLVLSKEKQEETIVKAFQLGAEDYLEAPVSAAIAAARLKRILEHYHFEQMKQLALLQEMKLTNNEKRLLVYMMKHSGKVCSRSELLEGAFPKHYEGIDRNIDNYVKQLRKKLEENLSLLCEIQTVYGVGYRYVSREEM